MSESIVMAKIFMPIRIKLFIPARRLSWIIKITYVKHLAKLLKPFQY